MVELKIIEIRQYGQYILEDLQGKRHSLILEFYCNAKIAVGDKIIMHASLLDKSSQNFVQPYAFGELKDNHGRDGKSLKEDELIALHTKDGDYILKRIYG